jgi:hypothetical protein
MNQINAAIRLTKELERAERFLLEFKHDAGFAILSTAMMNAASAGVTLSVEHHAVLKRTNDFLRDAWPSHFNMAKEHRIPFRAAVLVKSGPFSGQTLYVASDKARSDAFAPIYRLSKSPPYERGSNTYPLDQSLPYTFTEQELEVVDIL